MYSENFREFSARERGKPATLCNQICKQLVPVSGMPRPMPLPSVIFGQQQQQQQNQQSAAMPVILCLDVPHSHGQEAKASHMGQQAKQEGRRRSSNREL